MILRFNIQLICVHHMCQTLAGLSSSFEQHSHLTSDVQQYMRDVVIATRNHENVLRGASPHASIALHAVARLISVH